MKPPRKKLTTQQESNNNEHKKPTRRDKNEKTVCKRSKSLYFIVQSKSGHVGCYHDRAVMCMRVLCMFSLFGARQDGDECLQSPITGHGCVDSACTRSPKGSKLTSGRYVLLSVHTRACHQPLQWLGIQLGETSVTVSMKVYSGICLMSSCGSRPINSYPWCTL